MNAKRMILLDLSYSQEMEEVFVQELISQMEVGQRKMVGLLEKQQLMLWRLGSTL